MAANRRFYAYRTKSHMRQYSDYRLKGMYYSLARMYYEHRNEDAEIINKIGLIMDSISELREVLDGCKNEKATNSNGAELRHFSSEGRTKFTQ